MNTLSPAASGRDVRFGRWIGAGGGGSTAPRSRRMRWIRSRTGGGAPDDDYGHLPLERGLGSFELPADVLEAPHDVRAGGVQYFVVVIDQVLDLLLKLPAERRCLRPSYRSLLDAGLKPGALTLKLVEPVLEQQMLRLHQAAGLFKDVLGQSEPFGDGHGVAPAWNADCHPVRGLESVRVELKARVRHVVRSFGECCHASVVSRRDRGDISTGKMADYSLCQRRTLVRVGAGTQLVQQHQRPPARVPQDANDVADVGPERRNGL